MRKIQNYNFDVVIIGSGGAGLVAAIESARKNFRTCVVSKVHPLQSHTVAAQGGMNAAIGNIVPDDWRWHAYDTMKAADWIADIEAVEIMCRNARNAIQT